MENDWEDQAPMENAQVQSTEHSGMTRTVSQPVSPALTPFPSHSQPRPASLSTLCTQEWIPPSTHSNPLEVAAFCPLLGPKSVPWTGEDGCRPQVSVGLLRQGIPRTGGGRDAGHGLQVGGSPWSRRLVTPRRRAQTEGG